MNKDSLWHFLEKWTRPDNPDAVYEWKRDLDRCFQEGFEK